VCFAKIERLKTRTALYKTHHSSIVFTSQQTTRSKDPIHSNFRSKTSLSRGVCVFSVFCRCCRRHLAADNRSRLTAIATPQTPTSTFVSFFFWLFCGSIGWRSSVNCWTHSVAVVQPEENKKRNRLRALSCEWVSVQETKCIAENK